jgi:hypothetical protein
MSPLLVLAIGAVAVVATGGAPRRRRVTTVGPKGPGAIPAVATPNPWVESREVPLRNVPFGADKQARQYEPVAALPPGWVSPGKWQAKVTIVVEPTDASYDDWQGGGRTYFATIPLTVGAAGGQVYGTSGNLWRTYLLAGGGLGLDFRLRKGWNVARVRTTWVFKAGHP